MVAVCAVRTGCGKSQTSRRVGRLLLDAGLRVALVRHPMPYGDLERMRVQRFATLADIDAADPTVEEREEYETPVRAGHGHVRGRGLRRDPAPGRGRRPTSIVWDGGNNDFPFYVPDLLVTVVDPLRAGHELRLPPGRDEPADGRCRRRQQGRQRRSEAVARVVADVEMVNPRATVVRAASPVTLEPGPSLVGRRVLVVEDGPTITHGGMPFGAGMVAARQAGATELVDPRPYAVGSIAATYARYPDIGAVLPAMGYGDAQLAELGATIRAVPCDAVVLGTPMDLARLIDLGHPSRRASYELREVSSPTLPEVLAPYLVKWTGRPRKPRG